MHLAASNNVAEYQALINGLKIAIELGIQCLEVRGDSQLVVYQIMKESSCKSDTMSLYCQEMQKVECKFDGIELKHVPQKLNEAADSLAKMASRREMIPFEVSADDQSKPSIRSLDPDRANHYSHDGEPGQASARPLVNRQGSRHEPGGSVGRRLGACDGPLKRGHGD